MTRVDTAVRLDRAAVRARLAQVGPDALAQPGRVHVRAGALEIAPCGEPLSLRFGAPGATPARGWLLDVSRGTTRCVVELDTLHALLPGAEAACAGASALVRGAVLAQIGATVWDALGCAGAAPLVQEREHEHAPLRAAGAGAQCVGFVVENRHTGRVSAGRITLPTAAAARDFAAALAQRAPQPLPTIPIDIRFHVGTARLTAAELRSLHPGAVVLLARLPSTRGRWRAQVLAGCRRTPVATGFIEGDNVVTDKVNPAPASEPVRDNTRRVLEAVAVELAFEIGRATLPLEQLLQLAPGHVFELGAQPEGDVVELTLNGNVVGAGHLVLVGDVLGVRVARLWLDDPALPGAAVGEPQADVPARGAASAAAA